MSAIDDQPVVGAESLSKYFGPVRAVDGVDLRLCAGEVHGIVGENGAGKSTLMKLLGGIEIPTAGRVLVDGHAVRLRHPADARRLGIVMIHQELNLVDELSVADNIFLGRERTRCGLLDRRHAVIESRRLLNSIECTADPRAVVKHLSIADRQLVEIAKALSQQARVLIMDEPTAVLTRREVQALFALICRLRHSGVAIVYISHILGEVLNICDRITVMRDGRIVTSLDRDQARGTTEQHLARLMVGRPIGEHFPPRRPVATDQTALSVSGLSVPEVVSHVGFDLRHGEIFGLAGLIGAGRTETAEAIAGLRRYRTGEIRMDGRIVSIRRPQDAVRYGIAYLSEDRKAAGLNLNMDVTANTTLVSLRRYMRGPLIDRRAERAAASAHVRNLGIRIGRLSDPVSTLSGGNQQKVLIAKWLESHPRVLILDEPTRGVDIGAKEEIYRLVIHLAADGMACLLISSEINELLGLCHRIGVMRNGRIVRILDAATASEQDVIEAAAAGAASHGGASGAGVVGASELPLSDSP